MSVPVRNRDVRTIQRNLSKWVLKAINKRKFLENWDLQLVITTPGLGLQWGVVNPRLLQMIYYTLVAITMVTGFLSSIWRLMKGLGAHQSVNKDRKDGYSNGVCQICIVLATVLLRSLMMRKKKSDMFYKAMRSVCGNLTTSGIAQVTGYIEHQFILHLKVVLHADIRLHLTPMMLPRQHYCRGENVNNGYLGNELHHLMLLSIFDKYIIMCTEHIKE